MKHNTVNSLRPMYRAEIEEGSSYICLFSAKIYLNKLKIPITIKNSNALKIEI